MKSKLIIGAVCVIFFMIPIISASAIISNPFGFLGDIIFGSGDTTKVSKDVVSMYNDLIKSNLGKEINNYINELETKNKVNYQNEIITFPLILSFSNKDFKNSKKEITINDYDIKNKIKTLFDYRMKSTNETEYFALVKKNSLFSKFASLSDTTINNYLKVLSESIVVDGDIEDINVDKDIYHINNPFIPNYLGQCTWFCWSRTKELTGKLMPTGNARDWLNQTNLRTGQKPKARSVAVFSGSNGNQHVIFIEKFANDTITFSEGNYNNPCTYGSCDQVDYARKNYKALINVETLPYSVFLQQKQFGMQLLGYIYTD